MNDEANPPRLQSTNSQHGKTRPEAARQELEDYPTEVLEAALRILKARREAEGRNP